jgi:hypothetical protein
MVQLQHGSELCQSGVQQCKLMLFQDPFGHGSLIFHFQLWQMEVYQPPSMIHLTDGREGRLRQSLHNQD